MWTEDRSLTIVFNGEVYNFKEIRPELEILGYRFLSGTDTEVVLNAIHCWGIEKALGKFLGMFAFAIWDARTRSLTLARDRVGVKPLYYHKSPKRLLFGSEIKALHAHPEFSRELCTDGLGQFFCFGYAVGEKTVYRDTYKLPAGHFMSFDAKGDSTLTRYWSIDNIERGSFRGTENDAVDRLTELCDSAFSYRLVSDVPVGVFLSGGIDSTFLATFLKKRLNADLEHITIGFDNPAFDESEKAAQVAKDLDLRHTINGIDADKAQSALPNFVDIWDEPFGDTSGIPTSILCKLARDSVKVALSADGGDELFCGYDSYPNYDKLRNWLNRFPFPLRKAAASTINALPYRALISAGLSLQNSPSWNPQWSSRLEKSLRIMSVRDAAELTQVMNEKGWETNSVGTLLNAVDPDVLTGTVFKRTPRANGRNAFFDHMMRTDFQAFLADDIMTKVDRASMAVSLECRDPLLDHRLVEFAFSLPLEYIYKDGEHKRLMKRILAPWISQSVLQAPKRGFSIPLYDWLRGPWKELAYQHLSVQSVRRVGILNEQAVTAELDAFYRYRGGRAEKVMLMLLFQLWAERWL